jgi:hypothetical protein
MRSDNVQASARTRQLVASNRAGDQSRPPMNLAAALAGAALCRLAALEIPAGAKDAAEAQAVASAVGLAVAVAGRLRLGRRHGGAVVWPVAGVRAPTAAAGRPATRAEAAPPRGQAAQRSGGMLPDTKSSGWLTPLSSGQLC